MFQQLTLIQKAMVLVYKAGMQILWLEEIQKQKNKDEQKIAVQRAYADAHKSLIGDEEARRKYWIAKMKE